MYFLIFLFFGIFTALIGLRRVFEHPPPGRMPGRPDAGPDACDSVQKLKTFYTLKKNTRKRVNIIVKCLTITRKRVYNIDVHENV